MADEEPTDAGLAAGQRLWDSGFFERVAAPPPWRDDEDRPARDKIAALIPADCDREAFLAEVKDAAFWFNVSMQSYEAPGKEREDARKQLKKLANSAVSLVKAYSALNAFGRLHLDASARGESLGNIGSFERNLREFERRLAPNDLEEQCTAVALRVFELAAKARDAIPKQRKSGNSLINRCMDRLAVALWRHTDRRPGRNVGARATEYSRLDELAMAVINPVLQFNGRPTQPTFSGYARKTIDRLPDERPGTDPIADLARAYGGSELEALTKRYRQGGRWRSHVRTDGDDEVASTRDDASSLRTDPQDPGVRSAQNKPTDGVPELLRELFAPELPDPSPPGAADDRDQGSL